MLWPTVAAGDGPPGRAVEDAPESSFRYEIEAKDGMPAEYRVELRRAEPGTWTVRAVWEGRGIAGLWLETEAGQVLHKRISASPIEMAFRMEGDPGRSGEGLHVRFSTTTNRGQLRGYVELVPPQQEIQGDPQADRDREQERPLEGPGSCLARGFGEDPVGRALEDLAFAMEDGDDERRDWAAGWATRLIEEIGAHDESRDRRDAIDRFWERFLRQPAPGGEIGSAFRGVLSGVESLVREESLATHPASARSKQTVLFEILGCIGDPS